MKLLKFAIALGGIVPMVAMGILSILTLLMWISMSAANNAAGLSVPPLPALAAAVPSSCPLAVGQARRDRVPAARAVGAPRTERRVRELARVAHRLRRRRRAAGGPAAGV